MIKNQQKTLGRNGRAVNSLNGDHFNLSCLSATAVTLREVLCEGTKKCLRGSNMKKQSFWTVRSLNKNMSSFGVKDIMKVQRFRIWWKLLISFFVTYCSVGFQRLNSIRDNHMFHWFFFLLLLLEPTYITIDPPACGGLSNCTLAEKDCVYGFKLDHNGCRTCQCKNSKYTEGFSPPQPNMVLSQHIMWLSIFFIPVAGIPLATWRKKKKLYWTRTDSHWWGRAAALFWFPPSFVFRCCFISRCIMSTVLRALSNHLGHPVTRRAPTQRVSRAMHGSHKPQNALHFVDPTSPPCRFHASPQAMTSETW